MSTWMHSLLLVTLAVLGILTLLALLYAVLGKRFTDKIVAANMIGTLGVNMIVVLAIFLGADYILDVSLVFALLSFLMVIVLCRFVQNKVLFLRQEEKMRQGNGQAEEQAVAEKTGTEEDREHDC